MSSTQLVLSLLELEAITSVVVQVGAPSCFITVMNADTDARTVTVSVPAAVNSIQGHFSIPITQPDQHDETS